MADQGFPGGVLTYYYRPQTKFTKVMFLHVSVCPQGGGDAWSGGGSAPRGVGVDIPPFVTATAAGGTHPTGMHPCLEYFLPKTA